MLTRLGAAAALALAGSACPSDVITNYNTSPTASINYPTEGALLTGSVDFQGRVSDNQQSPDTLSVQWTSNVDGVLDATPSDADGVAVFTSASLTYGSQVVTLTAVDDKASSGTATVTFTLVPPQPEVQILDPASGASFTVGD